MYHPIVRIITISWLSPKILRKADVSPNSSNKFKFKFIGDSTKSVSKHNQCGVNYNQRAWDVRGEEGKIH